MDFANKIVIITGGAGGLGTGVTEAYLKAGAVVIVPYIYDEKWEALRDKNTALANNLIGFKVNVLDEQEVENFIDKVIQKYKRVDVLVNLVGGFFSGVNIADLELDQWNKMMNLNMTSAFLCTKHVLPHMISEKYGKIVNIGSKAALNGMKDMSAYGAAKAAVVNFTEALAAEVKQHNINSNAIVPSIIDTDANRKSMPDADYSKWLKPESIARVILFLTSEDAKDITGAVLPIKGVN
ncbi:SDR family NAD(P)-dependent oxidoreductase [candidate division KSB1 bacterium]|nr:SDR family NAD(P)-dependent oxidoreductase [candidate division KSB1 bacterium]